MANKHLQPTTVLMTQVESTTPFLAQTASSTALDHKETAGREACTFSFPGGAPQLYIFLLLAGTSSTRQPFGPAVAAFSATIRSSPSHHGVIREAGRKQTVGHRRRQRQTPPTYPPAQRPSTSVIRGDTAPSSRHTAYSPQCGLSTQRPRLFHPGASTHPSGMSRSIFRKQNWPPSIMELPRNRRRPGCGLSAGGSTARAQLARGA